MVRKKSAAAKHCLSDARWQHSTARQCKLAHYRHLSCCYHRCANPASNCTCTNKMPLPEDVRYNEADCVGAFSDYFKFLTAMYLDEDDIE